MPRLTGSQTGIGESAHARDPGSGRGEAVCQRRSSSLETLPSPRAASRYRSLWRAVDASMLVYEPISPRDATNSARTCLTSPIQRP